MTQLVATKHRYPDGSAVVEYDGCEMSVTSGKRPGVSRMSDWSRATEFVAAGVLTVSHGDSWNYGHDVYFLAAPVV